MNFYHIDDTRIPSRHYEFVHAGSDFVASEMSYYIVCIQKDVAVLRAFSHAPCMCTLM